jgi:hypothetical protein
MASPRESELTALHGDLEFKAKFAAAAAMQLA